MDVEVAVVGAGAMGSAAAWRLARSGYDVLLIERAALGAQRGSSHGPTRIFRLAYPDPLYVAMAQRARPLWRELEGAGPPILRTTGGLDVGDRVALEPIAQALSTCGAVSETLEPGARAVRFPWLEAGHDHAVYSPDTGVLAAARALEAMIARARASGSTIWDGCSVTAIEAGDGVRLSTDRGVVRARRCVIAAGAWTAPLLEPIGIAPALRVTQEQVFYFRPREEHDVLPFIHHGEVDRYAVPADAGSPGVKVAEHGTGREATADEHDGAISPNGRARVIEYVRTHLPWLRPDPIASDTCLYTSTPDQDFLIDEQGPLVIASPCSGHGFKFAPLIGEVLACMATDRPSPIPLERFSLAKVRASG